MTIVVVLSAIPSIDVQRAISSIGKFSRLRPRIVLEDKVKRSDWAHCEENIIRAVYLPTSCDLPSKMRTDRNARCTANEAIRMA
jgi:hypothetical protein